MMMLRAGLPKSVILGKIRGTPGRFALRTEVLVGLKQAGVPYRVLDVMVQTQMTSGSTVGPQARAS